MKKIYAKDLSEYSNQTITFSGFLDTKRITKWVIFLILRDSTGKLQVTIEKKEENQAMIETIENLGIDSTVKVEGTLQQNEAVRLGGLELIPTKIEITSVADSLPFNYKDLSKVNIDTRLDYKWLDFRNEKNLLIRKIESTMIQAMRNYLYQKDFIEIHTPKLLGTASESGSKVFEVKYFHELAYLAQSPQFYKQMAIAGGLEKVFEVAPAFRAENSNTYRHATEFTSFDLEFSDIDSYEGVMDLEEDLLIAGLNCVKEKYSETIKEHFGVDVIIPTKPFPRIKLKDLYQELKERYGYQIPEEDIGDMNTEAEKLTGKFAMEKYGHEFIFITGFAATKRAFYHMRDKNGELLGYDLIWRGTEITTGAQREHRYEQIVKNAQEKGLTNDVKYYLEFFKYGCPPHGGFGLGVDRLTMLLLGLPSIKEAQFLFRGPNRLTP